MSKSVDAASVSLPRSPSPADISNDTIPSVDMTHTIGDVTLTGQPTIVVEDTRTDEHDVELATVEDLQTASHPPGHTPDPRGSEADEPVVVLAQKTHEERIEVVSEDVPLPPTPSSKPCVLPPSREVSAHGQVDGSSGPAAESPSKELRIKGSRSKTASVSEPESPISKAHKRSLTLSRGHNVSIVLISSALESIAASREAKRSNPLRDSTQRALELIRSGKGSEHPREIFEPLRLACDTRNEKLMIASLDCISKLISYSFFAQPEDQPSDIPSPPPSPHLSGIDSNINGSQTHIPKPSLVDLVAHTITACHAESTPETVSLQIVKALLSLVLSPTVLVHHSSLLKAVRTVYNVFLLSTDPVNQMVAQGGLTQMVHHIFTRCRRDAKTPLTSAIPDIASPDSIALSRTSFLFGSAEAQPDAVEDKNAADVRHANVNGSSGSLPIRQSVEGAASHHGAPSKDGPHQSQTNLNNIDVTSEHSQPVHYMSLRDMFVKDAFLVFRALCKLTMKPLNTESERDPKSHAMRSKLLSLHLVLTVLNSHMPLFVDPTAIIYSNSTNEATTFIQAINQYLCLSLSRNAVSPVPQVFEISVEIFWRVLSGMRTKLKKEIEVLLHEIFIPILEMKTSTLKQKAVILGMFSRLCQDPQALVEIYLNYDCDGEAVDNIYEHLMNIISKIGTTPIAASQQKNSESGVPPPVNASKSQSSNAGPAPMTAATLSVPGNMDTSTLGLSESHYRRQGLECLVAVLRSLVAWGTAPDKSNDESIPPPSAKSVHDDDHRREPTTPAAESSVDRLSLGSGSIEALRQPTPEIVDDPSKFESAKQKKTTFLEGIKKFNFKPKRGIKFLVETGFIPSQSPEDVAKFLLITDGLSKAMIGEYLGEGDDENIATMHAFVNMLDFKDLPFVNAMRIFLQAFRLPGEAQKIDRFMLKFAERYIAGNSKTPFANADAAYVLAYSVIMLNTDAHNPQVKKRMTKADFVKNNRGINDGQDLPEEFLSDIFDDIASNEIRMKDEVEHQLSLSSGPGITGALANVGRDLQMEAFVMQSNGMANKTEALFRTMMRTQRKGSKSGDQFFSASHFVHVRPMFEVAWIPFLAGLSGPLQETNDLEIVELCLDGFKNAIHIVCFFELELQRNAFLTTLAKFTFLNNLGEMKTKNMEAIKTLLDVAVREGNHLRGSWHEVLTCVSQLEHMQLISSGVDIPDQGKNGRSRKLPNEELANESRSTHITVAADMVFHLSRYLTGTAIVDFVRALCDVSWEEIQSSGLSQHPRLFSLQKLVEISYYNMSRIRLEWSNLWDILGEHFNQICCHSNPRVCFFALDSIRQLAMGFLEKEELPHFKFQKDFLKPFEYTMIHNNNPEVRDMVLQCLQQMIQARVQNMRSGWRTMFGVFSAASKVLTEKVANSAFEIVTRLNKDHFRAIVRHGAFADLTVCITEFCKVSKYQKISLLAIAMLRGVIPVMLECPECSLGNSGQAMDDAMIRYWFPVLFGFYDIIMNGEDLEVRRLALDSLFSTLRTYGATYPIEFWDTVCQELLFPIFSVLKSSRDLSRFSTQEDMSVWLSTTMIQALRDLVNLYTYFFEILERLLDGLLDLLCVCICQENDTLARIGTSCLQQLLENNITRLTPSRWERIASTFVTLFRTTTPHQLFDESLRVEIDGNASDSNESAEANGSAILPAPLLSNGDQSKNDAQSPLAHRRRVFKQIIVKCVLQLLLIETTNELLRNDEVYRNIPPEQLLRFMSVLDQSYRFARGFNEDKELRTALWKVGFMKHLPNLLKQESSSAATLVHVLLRMYYDNRPEHQTARPQIAERLLPLGKTVLEDYNKLRPDAQAKNILALTPVVAEILDGFCRFDEKSFKTYLPAIYPLATELLSRELASEVRLPLKTYFIRVGYAQGIIDRSS